uniref:Histone H2A n=1 Tax=Megaselia scalaris TaxID=36166 RepID=T1GFN5_MEGSC
MLCTNPPPHNVTEIEERMKRMIPPTIDHYASKEGREVISKKKKTVLPVDRIHHLLQKEILQFKIDNSVSLYLVAVLEYVSADIFKLAGDYVRNIKTNQITKEDIEVVINADEELKNMFYQTDENSMIIPSPLPSEPPTYEEVVKNLINDEKHYLRDLHMILKELLEGLSPFEGMDENEINDYTYNESLRIEPKHCKVPPKFPRKWPKIPLKSPGIKPKHKHMGNNNTLNHNNHHRGSICNKSMMDQSPPDGTNHLGVNDHSFVSFQHSSNFSMDTISLMSTTLQSPAAMI